MLDGLLYGLQFQDKSHLKPVHRLDKDTSGALLIARTHQRAGSSPRPSLRATPREDPVGR